MTYSSLSKSDSASTLSSLSSRQVSPIDQPDYLNTAVIGTSRVPPEALLGELKRIEYRAGRRRGRRLGPRVLDIDLLLWGQEVRRLPELTLPHPRLRQRAFVLAPLAEIAGDWRVPPDGRTVADLWSELGPQRGLERCDWSHQPLL